jgi:glycosyltransferase involved in cell wall biosynthesis
MSSNPPETAAEPALSVIVPCYNSARTIRRCLRAIADQTTSIPFEVIVVDSSIDETPRIVASEFPHVKLIHLDQRAFPGAARNVGARAARARLCLMIDSDCVAASDLIDRMLARHASGEYAVVGGSLGNGTPRSPSGWVSYLIEFKEFMPSAPERLVWTVPTANATYRREVLERHGCFDPDMPMAEDILLNWRMHEAGERILFDPEIRVVHLNRTGWREVFLYQVGLGRQSALARRRGGLPGKALLRYPALIALLPFGRFFRAVRWLAANDIRALLVLLLLSPAYLIAAGFWTAGFFKGARLEPESEAASLAGKTGTAG